MRQARKEVSGLPLFIAFLLTTHLSRSPSSPFLISELERRHLGEAGIC